MADVVFNMTAEEGRFVSAMMNALQAQKNVKDEFKSIKREAKEAEENYVRAGKAQAEAAGQAAQKQEELTGKIAGTAGVLGGGLVVAAAAASQALQEMFDAAAEKGSQANEQILKLASTLQDFGQIDLLPNITEKLSQMRSATMSQDQIKGLFSQISKAGGSETSPELRLAATNAAVDAADAGFDPLAFGKTFIDISKLKGTKDLSMRQRSDMTTRIMQETEGKGLDAETNRDLQRAEGMGLDDLPTIQKIMEFGIGRGKGGEAGKLQGELIKEALTDIRPDGFKPGTRKEIAAEAQANIKKLETESQAIEQRQRALQDREMALEHERSSVGNMPIARERKEAQDRLG